MAFITLSGTLLDPNGDLAVGDQIRFTHKSTTGETLESAVSIITINPAGTYSLPLQYGLVLVEYKDVRTQQFKNLGVATVNATNPATSIPELLNALVPVSSAELIEFQAILADCVTAQTAAENAATTAEAFAYQLTTTDLIASTATFTANTNIPTSGFTTSGDGGNGSWKQNGVTGQTPSQTPAQLGDALLNDGNGNQWSAVRGKPLSLAALGGGSTSDDTSSIVAWLNAAGDLHAGDGTFTIEATGPDSGGAYVNLLKNTKVTCSPNATFKAGQDLDNDMIRLEVPDGPQASQVTVEWSGGTFDQRLQRNSTSIPFSTNYPGANPGTSATTDGLSIIGVYIDTTPKQGIKKCSVHGVTFIASDKSWESAGGDSGLNIASDNDTVYDNKFIGLRDLGVYHSSDSVAGAGLGLAKSFKCHSNTFERCMFGVSSKRGAENGGIYGNNFIDCMQSVATEPFDKRSKAFSITGNTINGYIFGFDIGSTDGVTITGNTLINAGVLLENGTVPTVNFTNPEAIALNGTIDATITGNTISGKIAEFAGNNCEGVVFSAQDTGSGLIDSDDNLVMGNIIKNIDTPFFAVDLLNNSIELNKVSGTNNNEWDMSNRVLRIKDGGELTISSGTITVNSSKHNVDTEAASASDDLDTISGGQDGQRLVLRANSSTRTVVIKDSTGNIQINGDFSMTNQADRIELIYDSSTSFWYELSRSDNAA